jgi:hypothetical protein
MPMALVSSKRQAFCILKFLTYRPMGSPVWALKSLRRCVTERPACPAAADTFRSGLLLRLSSTWAIRGSTAPYLCASRAPQTSLARRSRHHFGTDGPCQRS